jgi:hypothetical protein
MRSIRIPWVLLGLSTCASLATSGCGKSADTSNSGRSGGSTGLTSTGGSASPGSGGSAASGGTSGTGGAQSLGGSGGGTLPGQGGNPGTGGSAVTGGSVAAGGSASSGGIPGAGGTESLCAGKGPNCHLFCSGPSDCSCPCEGGTGGKLGSGGAAASTAAGGIGAGGNATGGIGAGGRATGGIGAGGLATGGAPSLDGGSPDSSIACSQVTSETDCIYRIDCHAVYKSENNCACAAAGCCTHFDRCADGKLADCKGPAMCEAFTPFCEQPYVLSFRNSCYEGCVQQGSCPVPACPQSAPKDGSTCEPVDHQCYYEDCAGAGRTLAQCTGSKWQVQTGACTSISCPGGGMLSPSTITCDAGKVCVRTTGGGGAYVITPGCVDQRCGTGPVSESCIDVYQDSCAAHYSLSGVTVNCSSSSSCGSGSGGCQ